MSENTPIPSLDLTPRPSIVDSHASLPDKNLNVVRVGVAGVVAFAGLTGAVSIAEGQSTNTDPNCASPSPSLNLESAMPSFEAVSPNPDGSFTIFTSPSLDKISSPSNSLEPQDASVQTGVDLLTANGSPAPEASPVIDTNPENCQIPNKTLTPDEIENLAKKYSMDTFLKTKNHAIDKEKFKQIIDEEAKILFDNQEDIDAYIEAINDILNENLHNPHLENTADALATTISQAVDNAARFALQGDLEKANASLKVAQAYRGAELKYIRFDDKPGINTLAEKIKAIDAVTEYYYKNTHHTQ